jgi:uncharacterized protein (DUF3084 family)
MGTALVVGLLVVMCGGIAYVGDTLGRRMGKKRLSVFGLRPRHTAIVFTVITGMVIAAVTLGVLLAASDGVRVALTRGERLLHDNRVLRKQRRELDILRHKLFTANYGLQQQNTVLSDEGERLRGETRSLLTRNRGLEQKNGALILRNGQLLTGNSHLLAENTRLSGDNRRLHTDNRALTRSNQQLNEDNHRLTRSNAGLRTANTGLAEQNRRLRVAVTGLEQARHLVQKELTHKQAELTLARGNLRQVQEELGQTMRAVQQAEALRRQAEDRLLLSQHEAERATVLESAQLVVRWREELARRVIPPGASAAAVREAIEGLLDDADRELAHRDGRAAEGSVPRGARRVRLSTHGAPPAQVLEGMVTLLRTESHPMNGVVPDMPMPERHPLVVRALAGANVPAASDDPVEVDVVGKANLLAFRRGEEVARMEVSSATTTGQLLTRLVSFLQRQVREEALKRSVLPDAGGRVGEIDYESLLDVVARVKRLPGPVKVGAVAAQEAWTAGPLRLDFYVVPAERRVAEEKRP